MNRDKKNAAWLATNFIISSISSLLILKLNLENFGNQRFGIWLLLSSIWGFGTSLDLGFGTSIIKYVAEYNKKNSSERISVLLASSLIIFSVLGVLIILVGNIFAFQFYFSNEKIIAYQFKQEFIVVFVILSINFFIRYLTVFFNNIFEGLSEFSISSKLLILQSLMNLINVVIVFAYRLSIIHLTIGQLIVTIINFLLFWTFLKLKHQNYSVHPRYFEFLELKKILSFSFNVQLMSIFNTIIDPIIKFIIARFYQVNTIPAYEIARRITIAISGLFFSSFKFILPKASGLITKEHQKEFLENSIINFSKIGVLYSVIFYGILLPVIIFCIDYVFNLREAILIFLILSMPETINNFGYSLYNFILGIGKVSILILIQLNNLITTTITVILFFLIFNNIFGMIGYLFSVIAGNIIMLIFLKNEFKLNIKLFLRNSSFYKLSLLIILLVIIFISIYKENQINYYFLLLFSILLSLIFLKDLIYYFKSLFTEFFSKKYYK